VIPVLVLASLPAAAQDMEPRSYANSPVGLNIVLVSYAHSSGNVLVDASLPVEDVSARIEGVLLGYARTFGLLGCGSKLVVAVPTVHLFAEGLVEGQYASGTRDGLADPVVRLNVNFLGAPALGLKEFVQYRQKTILGASLEVRPPLGEFNPDWRVNIGTNRWTVEGELGLSRRWRRWTLEASGSATVFTDNTEYLGTSTLSQEPITAVQGHVIFNFPSSAWISLDSVWVWGGQSSVDGVERADLQTTTRVGSQLTLPLARRHSFKFLYARGLTTRIGADFTTLGVAYQFLWGGGM
jgi:hypothetical protein